MFTLKNCFLKKQNRTKKKTPTTNQNTTKQQTLPPTQTQKKNTWKIVSDKLIIAYRIKLAAQVSQEMLFNLSLGMGLYNAST